MIVVTGTGRSGTSMWLQVLEALGLTVVGDAFPNTWDPRVRASNSRGFYESTLVDGINFHTNPNPHSGALLVPEQTRALAVKIFSTGLVSTERAFLDRVIVSVRHWRSFRESMLKHRELIRSTLAGRDEAAPNPMPPVLKWWVENHALLVDAHRRGYAVRFISYESVLAEPERVVPETIDWLGVDGSVEAAIAAVQPSARPAQQEPWTGPTEPVDGVSVDCLTVMDELFSAIHGGHPIDDAGLWERVRWVEATLRPRVTRLERSLNAARWKRRTRS